MADMAVLTQIVETEAKALGFDLVRVIVFGKGEDQTLQIMAERPATRQLTIDDCAALSRGVSEQLDILEAAGNDPIDGAYRLEVSSPGIDRPLTRLRDFIDWAGHEVRVLFVEPMDGRKQVKAMIAGVEDGAVLVDDPKSGRLVVDFSNIATAKLVLTDALISATVPLSTEGADEIVTQEQED